MQLHTRLIAPLVVGLVMTTSLLFTARMAGAATYYVATTGSDTRSCATAQTLGTPKLTITNALRCLSAGDTLSIRGGVYSEPINNGIPSGTSWANATTIAAYPNETVELRPTTDTFSVIGIDTPNNVQYVIFDRLIVNGINTSLQSIYLANGANHIRVQNSEVKNSGADGIAVFEGGSAISPDFNEFINLDVHDTGLLFPVGFAHGFYISGSNTLVERCVVHDNVGEGIQVYASGGQTTNNNTLKKNRIYNSGTGHVNAPVGIVIAGGSENLVYDNLIYGNYGGGILIYTGSSNAKVYNNTIYNNSGPGIQLDYCTGTTTTNNIIFANAPAIRDYSACQTTSLTNLMSDPLFVNAAAANFHLKAGSPAIALGTTLSEVPDDFDGVHRSGGPFDIGAYRYGNALPQLPTNLRVVEVR